jgi:hypothetical protein
MQIEAAIKRKAATPTHDGSWEPIWQGSRAGAVPPDGALKRGSPCPVTFRARVCYTMSSSSRSVLDGIRWLFLWI